MSTEFKNTVLHDHVDFGENRRYDLTKEIFRDSSPLPSTLTYEDIDKEFKRWVEEDLSISFEGQRIPTMVLYSNQRFSEYKQSWEFTDDKRNILLNFKTISREINPKLGNLNGNIKNIPGNREYTIKKVLSTDEAGREYYTIYKMKQPYAIDLNYKIGIITNKIELINEFNQKVNEKFKSIDCYIRPNGHFIPMKLNDISDDSERSLNDRDFYSQSYNITVMAYIIDENSYNIEEAPVLKLLGIDTGDSSFKDTAVDVEEDENGINSRIIVTFSKNSKRKVNFKVDFSSNVKSIETSGLTGMKLFVNDDEYPCYIIDNIIYNEITYDENGILKDKIFNSFLINDNDEISIKNAIFDKKNAIYQIIFNCTTI